MRRCIQGQEDMLRQERYFSLLLYINTGYPQMDPGQIYILPFGFNQDSLQASWCGLSARHSKDS